MGLLAGWPRAPGLKSCDKDLGQGGLQLGQDFWHDSERPRFGSERPTRTLCMLENMSQNNVCGRLGQSYFACRHLLLHARVGLRCIQLALSFFLPNMLLE